jgi:hypothetical protein
MCKDRSKSSTKGAWPVNREALIHQLVCVRSAVDAALSLLMAEHQAEEGEAVTCRHPPNRRENLTTMGGADLWRCLDCGEEFADPPPAGEVRK